MFLRIFLIKVEPTSKAGLSSCASKRIDIVASRPANKHRKVSSRPEESASTRHEG